MNAPLHPHRDYGSMGRIGIAVPQANPTVEAEFSALMPRGTSLLACRLASREADQHRRFVGYLENLPKTLETYDTLRPDIIGFACTASSYLVGEARENELVAQFAAEFGAPIITGGQAILAALRALGAQRLAVLAPYPPFVVEAGGRYLAEAGFEIVAKLRVTTRTSDTRTIYELSHRDALAGTRSLDLARADCLLFTGTGMPSLPAIRVLGDELNIPVISTNLCLAWAMIRQLGLSVPPGAHPLLNGWQERIDGL
jgi:maleate isomerase